MIAASLLCRQNGVAADISWLSSMCARMLDGERGWIDIFETTPPVPTLLYMPGVLFARLLGVSAEITVIASAYAACIAALLLTDRLLPASIEGVGPSRWTVTAPAALFLFVLSNGAFAQREHFAAAFSLPMLALFIRRSEAGALPPRGLQFAAAALAGLAFAIKPPVFALPFVALAAAELIRTRSLAFLFPSLLPVAAAVGVGATAASLAAFPDYLGGVTALMRDVYVPARIPFSLAFPGTAMFGATFAVFAALAFMRRSPFSPAGLYALALTAGYVAVYHAQGKYFPYHLMPGSMFALIALTLSLGPGVRSALAEAQDRWVVMGAAAVIAAIASLLMLNGYADRSNRRGDLEWAAALDRPTAMAISPDISTSFPLATRIDARWIDRIHGQWVAHYARIMLAREDLSLQERARYQRYYDAEMARVRRLIRDKRPEIILKAELSSASWLTDALLKDDPTLLDDYELFARLPPVAVLRRRD